MKILEIIASLAFVFSVSQSGWAQSTTGGRSGGSTASTGTGYLTEGKRAATTNAQSMTVADEGSSRDYIYVPPTAGKNRSASPDGSDGTRVKAPVSDQPSTSQQTKHTTRQRKP